MIKRIVKILLILFLLLAIAVFYLSIFGVKTNKFNNQIINSILKVNKKIVLSISEVNYLLNPYNFTINIRTENPLISIDGSKLAIKSIQTNISLKSLVNDQFIIDDLQIITKEIKLQDAISLTRSSQDVLKPFLLDVDIKEGFVVAIINLSFNKKGEIKENYQIQGSVKKLKFNFLNQFILKKLNFDFEINKNNYLFKKINTRFNDIKIASPLIEVIKKKNIFFVSGKVLSDNKKFDTQKLERIIPSLIQNIDIKKIEFSSANYFSFNINNNLKLKDLKVEAGINLKQLIIKKKSPRLKFYLPNFADEIRFENHKIKINYDNNKFDITGKGNFLLDNKLDSLTYQIIKKNDYLSYESEIKLKKNSLLINFLDYEKKEGHNSIVTLKGIFKKNDKLRFDLISLKEKNNEILIKGLNLDKKFKNINIDYFNLNYQNNRNILNRLNLKKDNLNFIISGESFDASQLINKIMDSNQKNQSIFDNLNSKINIKINKIYIDEINYIKNLYGYINLNNNKINDLRLESVFPNKKKINLSIKTNKNSETITKLFSGYPKPLIKRYDFIQGFEGGNLDFYSTKKDGVSNSVLVIDNFKVKQVPVFAKLLSLASLQGIADLLTGEGIRFTDFEMNFSNKKGLTTIEEMYAIGPAVSILLDGYIETKKLISLRGTLVPATTINRSIASIPLLGKILIGDKVGEGVFGVSFKIKGAPKNLKTTVNPIKSLTPRFITRTLEKIKKN